MPRVDQEVPTAKSPRCACSALRDRRQSWYLLLQTDNLSIYSGSSLLASYLTLSSYNSSGSTTTTTVRFLTPSCLYTPHQIKLCCLTKNSKSLVCRSFESIKKFTFRRIGLFCSDAQRPCDATPPAISSGGLFDGAAAKMLQFLPMQARPLNPHEATWRPAS